MKSGGQQIVIAKFLRSPLEGPFSGSYFLFFVLLFPVSLLAIHFIEKKWELYVLVEIFFIFLIPKLIKDIMEGMGELKKIEDFFDGISSSAAFLYFHAVLMVLVYEGLATVTIQHLSSLLFAFYPALLFHKWDHIQSLLRGEKKTLGERKTEVDKRYQESIDLRKQSENWRERNKARTLKKSEPMTLSLNERRRQVFKDTVILSGEGNFSRSEIYLYFFLEPEATMDELRSAYRKFLKENHPDLMTFREYATESDLLLAKRKTELAIKLYKLIQLNG